MLVEPCFFDVLADVPEKFVLARQFGVALEVVCYLHEVVTQALEINVLGSRRPPKMKVALLQIRSLKPDLGPAGQGFPSADVVILGVFSAQQDPAHQTGVIARKDLAFEGLTLRYGQTPHVRIHKIRRSLIHEVTTVLFERILAVAQMRHDSILIIDPLRNSIGLGQVLLMHFVALFVACRRISLFWQIVVSIAAPSLDYEVVCLLEEILRLVAQLVSFVA